MQVTVAPSPIVQRIGVTCSVAVTVTAPADALAVAGRRSTLALAVRSGGADGVPELRVSAACVLVAADTCSSPSGVACQCLDCHQMITAPIADVARVELAPRRAPSRRSRPQFLACFLHRPFGRSFLLFPVGVPPMETS